MEVGSVKQSTVHAPQPGGLLKGLIGPSMTADVILEGQPCRALIDSGSRVTIIFESWYSRYLSHEPLQSVTNLAIWGLSDSDYPYKGHLAVSHKVQRGYIDNSLLVLICPDPKSPDPVPVIIGTNSPKLCPLLNNCEELDENDRVHSLRKVALTPEEPTSPRDPHMGVVAEVKWQGPGPLTLPPGGLHYATCKVEQQLPTRKNILIVEATNLPAGVLVTPVVLTPSAMDVNNFTLVLRNESQKETAVLTDTVLAQVYLVDTVTELKKDDCPKTFIDPKLFHFGNSPIPETWKTRLAAKLSERADVFSLDEWDVGLAKGVNHHI